MELGMHIHQLNQRSEAGRGELSGSSYAHHFERAREAVRAALPDPEDLSSDQCRLAIRRYCAAVTPNFIKWLSAASLSARSQDARYAASENAMVEIRDDHPGMLKALARSSHALPDAEDYEAVERYMLPIQSRVALLDGLFLIALDGCIEHTSLEFVPWVGRVAHQLGNTSTEYVDVHGEADIGHAEQFVWALEKEAALYEDPDKTIDEACDATVALINGVLVG
jgi:hypothetical protein